MRPQRVQAGHRVHPARTVHVSVADRGGLGAGQRRQIREGIELLGSDHHLVILGSNEVFMRQEVVPGRETADRGQHDRSGHQRPARIGPRLACPSQCGQRGGGQCEQSDSGGRGQQQTHDGGQTARVAVEGVGEEGHRVADETAKGFGGVHNRDDQ
ncbi:Uncharacterised protein [Mycobacteroides abscessus subsp. abscessus]|nr:Uncharacterised protein [Mycobacteroides abscessus subsp. abscessus]